MNENEFKQEFGRNLKTLRLKYKVTQSEVADAIDLEPHNLNRIENGKSFPKIKTVIKLINYFKIIPSELFSFNSNENFLNLMPIKCRPPENRDPLPEEKEACREYLDAQIEILKLRIILLCGRVAVQSILGTTQGISRIRGKWYAGPNNSKMMPIFHPSYLLRNDSREKGSPKWLMWQDIQEIKRVYSQMD